MKKLEKNNVRMNIFLVITFLVFFVLIISRVLYLSLSTKIDGINLQEFASNRTTKIEVLSGKRGTVFDRNGDALAQTVSSYTLIAYLSSSRTTNINNPQHVVDKEYTAGMLATVLDISEEQLLKYLSKENVYQTEFGSKGRGLTELQKDEILALGLPGIDFIETQKRYYPYGDFASYTLGYAKNKIIENEDGSTDELIIGEMGIEKQFDEELSGEDGYTFYQKDRNGYKIAGTEEVTVPAKDGNDVYLTLDSNIQLFVESALDKVSSKYSLLEWSTILVADAKTGAILASSSTPSFDPNIRDMKNYVDYNVGYAYEPGSTMKIFSYMATMENGNYKGNDTYKSGVYVTKDGTEIGDWNRKGWGTVTFDYGFAMSSNVAVINLIERYISGAILKVYYNKLGFGSTTGIELPREMAGKIDFKYETEIFNAGFGQGITTTPIQNIKALTSISNNGVLLQPYIIDKIVDPITGEVIYEGGKKELEKVASRGTVEYIKHLMRNAVGSPEGTGVQYSVKGYDVIGKTGTAQVAGKNGYYNNTVIRSFAGMFPGDDPEIIIYYSAKDNGSSGVKYMSSAIRELVVNISKYLELDSSKEDVTELTQFSLGSYINKKTINVTDILKNKNLNYIVIGNGDKIINQYPKKGEVVTELDKIYLITNDSSIVMPNVVGYSVTEARTLLSMIGINYEVSGTGYVSSQSIKAGTKIKKEDVVSLVVKNKF